MRILFVEDDQHISKLAKTMFMNTAHDVILCPTPDCAIKALRMGEFDLVVLDMTFPNGSGDDVLYYIAQQKLGVPVVIHTGFASKFNSVLDYYTKIGVVRKVYEKPSIAFRDMLNSINSIA